jgi:hypothetical protein
MAVVVAVAVAVSVTGGVVVVALAVVVATPLHKKTCLDALNLFVTWSVF